MNLTVADIHAWLDDTGNAWSIGAMGAIAEFCRFSGQPGSFARTGRGGRLVLESGAIEIDLTEGVQPVAYEGLSARPERWTTTLDLCLPDAVARMSVRTTLTEVGPDVGALDEKARGVPLFDLGLGVAHLDACIRADDEKLVAILRGHAGRSLLDPENPAMAAIKEASPSRIFLSRLARIEVYQRIGSSANGVPTPVGPHTHVLPGLLKTGRANAATAPIPKGHVPALTLHPAGLFSDHAGHERPFDTARFEALQSLLARFAPPGYVAEKDRIASAVKNGSAAGDYVPARARGSRLAARVGLRQLSHLEAGLDLSAWRARFDRGAAGHGH